MAEPKQASDGFEISIAFFAAVVSRPDREDETFSDAGLKEVAEACIEFANLERNCREASSEK